MTDTITMPRMSYSAATKYHTCPKQYFEIKIAKSVEEPPGEAAIWGSRVHEAIENLLTDGLALPHEFSFLQPLMDRVNKMQGTRYIEHEIYTRSDRTPTTPQNGDAANLAIIDFLQVDGKKARLVDWKSGKIKVTSQLRFYAACVFSAFPEVESVSTAFAWLKEGKMTTETFTRNQMDALWIEWETMLKPIARSFEYGNFPMKPSGLCNGWCPVQSCSHWKPKRRRY